MDEELKQDAMAQTSRPMGVGYGSKSRETSFKELAIEGKIERLRTLLKSLVAMNDSLRREMGDLRAFMWEHAHEENGQVVIKISKGERYRIENSNQSLGQEKKDLEDENAYI